jgi:hypothetical protein
MKRFEHLRLRLEMRKPSGLPYAAGKVAMKPRVPRQVIALRVLQGGALEGDAHLQAGHSPEHEMPWCLESSSRHVQLTDLTWW